MISGKNIVKINIGFAPLWPDIDPILGQLKNDQSWIENLRTKESRQRKILSVVIMYRLLPTKYPLLIDVMSNYVNNNWKETAELHEQDMQMS